MNVQELVKVSQGKDSKGIFDLISDTMLHYKATNFLNFPIKGFFRARKHNHLKGREYPCGLLHQFNDVKEFWNPPPNFALEGRCNSQGESILYSSNRFITALLETKPKEGDYVTMSNFEGLLYFDRMPRFKINSIGARYLSQIDDLQKTFKNYNAISSQSHIDDLLDELFHNAESKYYKYSIPITKIFMTDAVNSSQQNNTTHGIIYSSIIRDKKSFCYALKPNECNKYFRILSIQTLEIIKLCKSYVDVNLVREAKFKSDKHIENKLILWRDVNSPIERIYFDKY